MESVPVPKVSQSVGSLFIVPFSLYLHFSSVDRWRMRWKSVLNFIVIKLLPRKIGCSYELCTHNNHIIIIVIIIVIDSLGTRLGCGFASPRHPICQKYPAAAAAA